MRAVNVAVTVTLDNGDVLTLNVAQPSPLGDNPAFLTTQVHAALAMLEPRIHDAIEAVHGRQQYRMPRPSDELLAPREPASEQVAPKVGQLVRFPDAYGDNTFRTLDPSTGIYEVYQPRGLRKGTQLQINTDATRWVVVTLEEL